MNAWICRACGILFPDAPSAPPLCPICEDYRQPVRAAGQTWTTLEDLARDHRNDFREQEPGLVGIGSEPGFAIGQRALLVLGDGAYCTKTMFRGLPERVELLVRARKDLRLYRPAEQPRRIYGPALPTPEELRRSLALQGRIEAVGMLYDADAKGRPRMRAMNPQGKHAAGAGEHWRVLRLAEVAAHRLARLLVECARSYEVRTARGGAEYLVHVAVARRRSAIDP